MKIFIDIDETICYNSSDLDYTKAKPIKENIKRIKNLPKIKGTKKIVYPGQNKFYRYKKNIKKEIKIPKNIKKEIKILLN